MRRTFLAWSAAALFVALGATLLVRAQQSGYYNPYTGETGVVAPDQNAFNGKDTGGQYVYNQFTNRYEATKNYYNPYTGKTMQLYQYYNPYTGERRAGTRVLP
jgi:hypothetical protein